MTRSKKSKIIMITGIILTAILGVLCYFLLNHPSLFARTPNTPNENRIDIYNYFYEADFSKKLEELDDYDVYLGYDRYVHYKDGAVTVGITDSNIDSFSKDVKFFVKYFNVIISGDREEYDSLFTKKYSETHEKKDPFTPQMLYDIQIEKLSVNEENSVTTYAYDVSYKIFKNNGTFRNDIYSDASKTVYFEIDDSEGEYKINAIKYYTAS